MKPIQIATLCIIILAQPSLCSANATLAYFEEAPSSLIAQNSLDSEESETTLSVSSVPSDETDMESNDDNSALLWLLFGIALAFLEFIVPGVILIFFGIGAWIVALTSYLGITGTLNSQLIAFPVISILFLICLRKWVKGKFLGHVSDVRDLDQAMEEFIGMNVVVMKDIVPGSLEGEVEFKGANWRAVSEEHINSGEIGVIHHVEGVTLHIQKKGE